MRPRGCRIRRGCGRGRTARVHDAVTAVIRGDGLCRDDSRRSNSKRTEIAGTFVGFGTAGSPPSYASTIATTYDAGDRPTAIVDSVAGAIERTYDLLDRLTEEVTPEGTVVTEYTYDGSHRMLTIKDPRNIVYLENEYDTAGRVIKQTQADGGEYEFDYTLNGSGTITQTDVTNPRGFVRRVAFESGGYPTSDTQALGETEEQTTSYSRLSGSHLIETTTDELGRVTRYQYDSKSNVTSITRLYGTSDAKTTTFTYDPTYNLLVSVTDPLNHTNTYGYDSQGRIQSVTDALSHHTTFTTNEAGQVLTATNALNKTTTFTYDLGDLVSVTTPLGHTATRFVDVAGRLLQVTDARGATTKFEYSNSNQLTKIIDPLGGQTVFTYDGNGNLLTLTDARSKTTTWTYDDMDRVETRADPLSRDESFTYDLMGNMVTWTDRKGQVTTYEFDALDRQSFVGFGTTGSPPTYASTIAMTYDAGNRPTTIVDSVAGTIERTYDLLDRLTEEETPEGTVSYTHDDTDRRATMVVAGQTTVEYSYDNANRLTGVTRGTATVTIAYDNADKRTSLTLPNGIVAEYGYDDDSHLTGLTYKQGMSTLGTLTYAYDANGQRTIVGGTYARTALPAALTSATYDDANQIATFGGVTFTYDDNGNLTSDGTRSFTWNVRDQLESLTGPVNASFEYDALGRRRNKTVSGTTTQFLYDGLNPIQELSSGTPTANLLTGLVVDEYFARTDASGSRNFITDALGSTIALADGAGAIQTEYSYDPFGTTTTSGASTGNSFAFTGRELDGTGLYYFRARYYQQSLQRFASEDPIRFAVLNDHLYRFVANAPTILIDPLGLQDRTPAKGQPNTTQEFNQGKNTTYRDYGADGKATRDTDYGHDHGQGDPHVHDWDWSKPRGQERGKGRPPLPDENLPGPPKPPAPPSPPAPAGPPPPSPWWPSVLLPMPNLCWLSPFMPGCPHAPGRPCGA
jgi:RHS repeat-associated protein